MATASTANTISINKTPSRNKLDSHPEADVDSTITGKCYRFTVLTDGVLRYEWAPDGKFEDRASVFAINRDAPPPEFRVKETDTDLEIITKRFHLTYDKTEFHPSGLSAIIKGFFHDHASVWRYGEECETLGGTARTLDGVDGRIELGPGIISRKGYATIDDSKSMLFTGDGFVDTRLPGEGRVDGYLFAYGHDYVAAIKALYAISGPQPLLPRWALGNWWSRYYAYSSQEYLALMDRFEEEKIPLSVAVIDMDWHVVDHPLIKAAGKTGWTGYTWNKQLIPDPPAFLADLHKRKLKVTLNDHPADGVQPYEELYKAMAKALDHDTSKFDPIHFDITDRRFLDAFFDVLHRPLEDDGVDFWWIDWQQGEHSRKRGIDPLWVLNHYHFLDNARDGKRPLTFSRYAGPGSHRYPVGFSGDSIVSWESLDFQPEFTLTASNIGYGWWSHDIGGHWGGSKDDELVTRWVQFGVYSPIMRLHSSKNQWTAKEPWKFGEEARKIMGKFLRLRHRLLPYIYTMNVQAAEEFIPFIRPMYWQWPDSEEAYKVKNQYYFGSELIVMPITTPVDHKLRLARTKGWLPPGKYVDITNGATYEGDRELWFSRPLGAYLVFAKEGSIVPFDSTLEPRNGAENPKSIMFLIIVGADGRFIMHEDEGKGRVADDIEFTSTLVNFTQATGKVEITSTSAEPREWKFKFMGYVQDNPPKVLVGGVETKPGMKFCSNGWVMSVGEHPANAKIVIELGTNPQLGKIDPTSYIRQLLNEAQINFQMKEDIWQIVSATRPIPRRLQVSRLHALDMEPKLLDAVLEYVLAS